jgi:hypothetical protein
MLEFNQCILTKSIYQSMSDKGCYQSKMHTATVQSKCLVCLELLILCSKENKITLLDVQGNYLLAPPIYNPTHLLDPSETTQCEDLRL